VGKARRIVNRILNGRACLTGARRHWPTKMAKSIENLLKNNQKVDKTMNPPNYKRKENNS
jgi:hypothetical protein